MVDGTSGECSGGIARKKSKKMTVVAGSAYTLRSDSYGFVFVEEFFEKTSGDTNLRQTTTFHNPG